MNKILYIFLILITVTNCTPKKVEKHHGVPLLEKKQNSLTVDRSNKNDIQKILGLPSTKSKFDKDIWIYVERVITQSEFKNNGQIFRAILGVGLQDVAVSGLNPRSNIEILGASSDHLIVDTKNKKLKIGEELKFDPNYAALLAVMTSPYVTKKTLKFYELD